jgi:hypothetical protein
MVVAFFHIIITLIYIATLGFTATGVGIVIFNRIGIRFSCLSEQIYFAMGLGFAVIAYAVFALAALQALYAYTIIAILILFIVLSFKGWHLLKYDELRAIISIPQNGYERIAFFTLVVCLCVAFLLVLTPEISKDALVYHLAVPKLFLKHQGFYFIDGNIFANYPLLGEMLYIIGLFLQGDILAKAVHFLFLLAILLGMSQFISQRIGENAFPCLSLLIFMTVPSVFEASYMAYSDLFVTYYCLGAVLAYMNWSGDRKTVWLIMCGIFTGLAIACKYTALLLPFLGVLGILWTSRNNQLPVRTAVRCLCVYLICVTLAGSPFYIKNWLMTGNPFYPFLYHIFGGLGWDQDQARLYDLFLHNLGMGRELIDYVLLPWNVSFNAKMNSPQFDGILGPIFLVLLPFALGLRKTGLDIKIITVYCILSFLFWASSAHQIRYLFHILPLLAILIGFLLAYYQRRKIILRIMTILIAGCLLFNFYYISTEFLKIRPLGVVFGAESKDDFLKRMLPSYEMFKFINQGLQPDSRILLIYMRNYGFLCDRKYYSDSMFESYTIQKILSLSCSPKDVYMKLKERGFTHILYDKNYIDGALSTFSDREKHLFFTFQEEFLVLTKRDRAYFLYYLR